VKGRWPKSTLSGFLIISMGKGEGKEVLIGFLGGSEGKKSITGEKRSTKGGKEKEGWDGAMLTNKTLLLKKNKKKPQRKKDENDKVKKIKEK